MSSGRGRGYSGRHHARAPRPGEEAPASPAQADMKPEVLPPTIEMEKVKLQDEEPKTREERRESLSDHQLSPDDETALKELLLVDEQYAPLLALLEQFSPGEDGIQFNRKLRHFETTVTNLCPDEARLQSAFASFRAAALRSAAAARRLAAVGASFTRQQRQQLLRAALLNTVMQGTFSKLDVLERANPTFMINAANLMGDYFGEARLCNGNKVHILAAPLLQYMRALLAASDPRAHRALATQLMQNGRELLAVLPQELDELSISIRLRLLTPPPVNIVWLLLSADLCLNKFLPLPNTLQQFYASHLELNSEENYSEVSYGSWKKSPEKDEFSNSDPGEKYVQNTSQISLGPEDDSKPKLRPILGAGAGLLRQGQQPLSVSQDNFEVWKSNKTLAKRYDLNSWRQNEEEKQDDEVFNPTVLPPPIPNPSYPITIPDYPPPTVRYNNYQDNPNPPPFKGEFANYLQQGDGAYIQNQYPNNTNFSSQGDFVPYPSERPQSFPERPGYVERPFPNQTDPQFPGTPEDPPYTPEARPERINNEVQKTSSRKPVENWRKEKPDAKDDLNRNKSRNWTRQRSSENLTEEEEDREKFPDNFRRNSREMVRQGTKMYRRNSSENTDGGTPKEAKTPPKRHVSDVPRNRKYWDHDDRCDKDYNS